MWLANCTYAHVFTYGMAWAFQTRMKNMDSYRVEKNQLKLPFSPENLGYCHWTDSTKQTRTWQHLIMICHCQMFGVLLLMLSKRPSTHCWPVFWWRATDILSRPRLRRRRTWKCTNTPLPLGPNCYAMPPCFHKENLASKPLH